MPQEVAIGLQRVYDYSELPSTEFLLWMFGAVTERSLDATTLTDELAKQGVNGLTDRRIVDLLNRGRVNLFGREIHFRLPKTVEAAALAYVTS